MSGAVLSMRARSMRGLSAAGFHDIAYVEWGDNGRAPPVICVHGLTRNGRDFDRLAAALAPDRTVVCPDIVGRGSSTWLADPAGYGYAQYCADMVALIARVGCEAVDWVGTSMGGLIGMMLAAQPNTPIRRLVLNDVGPFVPRQAIRRLADYVGKDPLFPGLDGLQAYLRQVHAPFGALDDAAWMHLALHGHRRLPDGRYGLAYDPAIGRGFEAAADQDIDLWAIWEKVHCPVLLLRGAESDILPADTARRMAGRAELVEIAGVGHAPSLMVEAQIAILSEWLARS
jgi:pimeloyl-ACP methyl ester carboxylesterase